MRFIQPAKMHRNMYHWVRKVSGLSMNAGGSRKPFPSFGNKRCGKNLFSACRNDYYCILNSPPNQNTFVLASRNCTSTPTSCMTQNHVFHPTWPETSQPTNSNACHTPVQSWGLFVFIFLKILVFCHSCYNTSWDSTYETYKK